MDCTDLFTIFEVKVPMVHGSKKNSIRVWENKEQIWPSHEPAALCISYSKLSLRARSWQEYHPNWV